MTGNNDPLTIEKQNESFGSLPAARTCKKLGASRKGKVSTAMLTGARKAQRRIHGPHGPRI
jgi:hypothetical protein